jgi:hypothetical protein
MARPRKEAHERLSAALPPVRMTDAELIAIGDQARAAGLSLSDFVRQRLTRDRITPKAGLVDARMLSEINRAGVNLNQIARHLNRGQGVPADVGDVLAELRRVLELVGRAYGS